MENTVKSAFKPFHESILDSIATANIEQLQALAELTAKSIVPGNEEKIAFAFKDRLFQLNGNVPRPSWYLTMLVSLATQEKANKEKAEKAKSNK